MFQLACPSMKVPWHVLPYFSPIFGMDFRRKLIKNKLQDPIRKKQTSELFSYWFFYDLGLRLGSLRIWFFVKKGWVKLTFSTFGTLPVLFFDFFRLFRVLGPFFCDFWWILVWFGGPSGVLGISFFSANGWHFLTQTAFGTLPMFSLIFLRFSPYPGSPRSPFLSVFRQENWHSRVRNINLPACEPF